jgi:hypothetical protein
MSDLFKEPHDFVRHRWCQGENSGCALHASPPIPHALAAVTMGIPIEHRGLAVTPLVGDDDPACHYLTLDEALSAGVVTVKEVSPYGSTNDVRVYNRADRPLLIVDGEELAGSVQNRVANLSVLVGNQRTAIIPVSCVEAGRCDGDTFRFASAPRIQFASGRKERIAQVSRSLRSRDERQADQAAIWMAIQQKADCMRSVSDTGAMAAIYEQHATALDEYVEALGNVERWRGAAFTVHGRIAGLELFDSTSTWRRLMPKIVRSYAIEALDEQPDAMGPRNVAPGVLLDALAEAETASFGTSGDGFDVRIVGKSLTGAALIFGSRIVHVAAFAEVLIDGRVSLPPWARLSNLTISR